MFIKISTNKNEDIFIKNMLDYKIKAKFTNEPVDTKMFSLVQIMNLEQYVNEINGCKLQLYYE